MRELGLDAYRFSVAWPRVSPTGRAGQRRRARLLRSAGRRPARRTASSRSSRCTTGTCRRRSRTRGGWPERDTADAFVEYAEAVAGALGDRVTAGSPTTSPGRRLARLRRRPARARARRDWRDALAAAHHLLLVARPGRRRAAARQTPRRRGRHRAQPARRRCRPRDSADGRRAAALVDGHATAGSSTRSSAARYPTDLPLRRRRAVRSTRATWRRSPRRSTSSASTTTPAPWSQAAPADGAWPTMAHAPRRAVHRHGLGGLPRRASRHPGAACTATTARRPIYITENGAAYDDVRRTTAGRSTSSGSATCASTSPPSPARSTPACRCAATSSGRSSTTSSGREGYAKRFGIVLRRLPDARAGAEGLLRLVPRLHR